MYCKYWAVIIAAAIGVPSQGTWADKATSKQPDPQVTQVDGTLQSYLALVGAAPAVRSANESKLSARFDKEGAGALPDPTISAGYMIRPVETRVGPQRFRVGLKWRIPWPSEIGSEKKTMSKVELSRKFAASLTQRELAKKVGILYWKLWTARQHYEIAKTHSSLLRTLQKVVEARISSGAANLSALAHTTVVKELHDDTLKSFETTENTITSKISGVVGRALPAEAPTTDTPLVVTYEGETDRLMATVSQHPQFAHFRGLRDAELAKAERFGSRKLPKVSVFADWMFVESVAGSTGKDAFVAGLAVSVPFSAPKSGKKAKAAKLRGASIASTIDAYESKYRAMLRENVALLRNSHRQADLFGGSLRKQAELMYQTTLNDYSAGDVSLARVLEAARHLLAVKTKHLRAQEANMIAQVELTFLLGPRWRTL